MEDGEAFLAVVDVSGGCFAEFGGAGPDAEQIVAYLEGDAYSLAKAVQACDGCGVGSAEQGTHFGSTGHEGGGFPANHVDVAGDGNMQGLFKADIKILPFGKHETG